jgi:hypothetical protein
MPASVLVVLSVTVSIAMPSSRLSRLGLLGL